MPGTATPPPSSKATAPYPPTSPAAWPPAPTLSGSACCSTPSPASPATTTYAATDPPPSLRAFVEDRDQYCHAPGCRRTARTCDLDHVIAYDHTAPDNAGGAGRTHPDNLRPECRRHHNLTTRGHWHCAPHDQPGEPPAVAWTSPSGHTWIVRSPSLTEPDFTTVENDLDDLVRC